VNATTPERCSDLQTNSPEMKNINDMKNTSLKFSA